MTEAADLAGDSPPNQAVGTGSATAGAMLKKAREEAGLHIGALSVGLKVPVSKLEALESGDLEQLSGPVFVRALASSVCRTLKIDPTPILNQLPPAAVSYLHQKGSLNEPFHGEGRGVSFSASDSLLRPSILAVAGLLISALVLLFLPELRTILPGLSSDSVDGGEAVTLSTAADSRSAVVSGPAVVSGMTIPSVPLSVPKAASAIELDGQTSKAFAAIIPTPSTASDAAGAPGGLLPDVPASAVAGSEVLLFKASAASWIEVTDARGAIALRKTLASGEVANVGGSLPLKVVVGRADVTEVYLRGRRLDLQVLAKENVARFEVK